MWFLFRHEFWTHYMKSIFLILFFYYFQKPLVLNNQMATFTLILHLLSLAHASHRTEEEFTPTFSLLPLHVHAALCCLVCLCCFRKELAFGEWGTSEFSLLASDGMMVKRPILLDGETVLVGFREEEWAQRLLGL